VDAAFLGAAAVPVAFLVPAIVLIWFFDVVDEARSDRQDDVLE
jgi:hypothetical protein